MADHIQDFGDIHPLLRQEYAIYTPSMHNMISSIGDWIDQKITGGYIYGPSRFGKSRTLKWYVRIVLEERFQSKVPLVVWSKPHSKLSEKEFWNLILKSTKFEFKEKFTVRTFQARYLLVQQLITLAQSANQNFVVLLIDEAQGLILQEWNWLLGLQNELDSEGYRLTVFSVASHQIGYQPDFYARSGNAHVSARFLAVGKRFYGVRSIAELSYILNGYDEDSEWPENSGTSYLKYFAPIEYENKLRLTDHTKEIWQTFVTLLPKELSSGVKPWKVELPMQHIALTVESILRSLSNQKTWDDVLSEKNLVKIVSSTGFTNYMRFITAPQ